MSWDWPPRRASISHELLSKSLSWNDEKIADMKERLLSRMRRWDVIAQTTLGVAYRMATAKSSAEKKEEIRAEAQRREEFISSMSVSTDDRNGWYTGRSKY